MDKQQEESRKQFEKYFDDAYGCHPTDSHDQRHVEVIWHVWQASRANIVVGLPRPSCVYADHSYPAYSQKQVENLLNSIGLSIKGD
ncbi:MULTISPECIES: hypothetical protein [unclassified Serratia (in: enterobacteria)]|uniref:hypothetical protein n=1 Tax=unclassified Serratia (in: enterobacteria) TaxID=2647522 RepID=UPI0021ADD389|nr:MULTISPECIES: hypothetical protein [unclassified Serratia (in: enterobacteria)]